MAPIAMSASATNPTGRHGIRLDDPRTRSSSFIAAAAPTAMAPGRRSAVVEATRSDKYELGDALRGIVTRIGMIAPRRIF
jgi:hypothetical protein